MNLPRYLALAVKKNNYHVYIPRGNRENGMNEEEMARRIEKLEEEQDTMRLSLRSAESFLQAIKEMLERWNKQKKT